MPIGTMPVHDVRHFAVSLWIEQGFSIKEVMTFAGHSWPPLPNARSSARHGAG
ncbi:MAG: hypothetical protein J0H17_11125 [Rhizobiales bacterium]|nr:hypothetical protein [Hyphomicrobiales bacterium]